METLRSALDGVVAICVIVFLAVWLLGAVYFTVKEPHRRRRQAGSIGGYFLPRVGIVVAVQVILRMPVVRRAELWRHVEYWHPVVATVGAIIAVAATALLVWARWTLGAMWAGIPLVKEEHRLVTRGPYGIVRHPIYTGLLGLAFGATLTFGFGWLLLVLALVIPFVLRRVYVEDRLMAGEFGAQYDAYRGRVPALFPFPGR